MVIVQRPPVNASPGHTVSHCDGRPTNPTNDARLFGLPHSVKMADSQSVIRKQKGEVYVRNRSLASFGFKK